MTTLIQNGTVVSATGSARQDVLIDGERIVALLEPGSQALGSDLAASAERVIDAAGKYVIPGGVDGHTHMEMPFGGTKASDTFETGTRAAAWGGTTTIVDFVVQSQGQQVMDTLAAWHDKAGRAVRDRLRLPPDHRRRRRRVAEGDGRADRGRHHQLQAVHGLPRRVPVRRRADPAGHADRGRQRRPDHDARGERLGDRRARPAGAGARRDRTVLSRRDPALADRAGGDPPRDHAGRPDRRAAVRRARLGQAGAWPGSPRPATPGQNVFGETCPQYLYLSLEENLGAPGLRRRQMGLLDPAAVPGRGPPGRAVALHPHRRRHRRRRPTTARSA